MQDFNGITIGGKSVEDFLTDEKTKEINEAKQDKYYPKKKGRDKYMEHKEPNGEVKVAPQSALNRTNLESNLLKAKELKDKLVYYLLAGRMLTAPDVSNKLKVHQTTVGLAFRKLLKSKFGQHIEVGRIGKAKSYTLTVTGRSIKPGNAIADANTAVRHKDKAERFDPTPTHRIVPVEKPIIKDVVLNLTLKIKVEIV